MEVLFFLCEKVDLIVNINWDNFFFEVIFINGLKFFLGFVEI